VKTPSKNKPVQFDLPLTYEQAGALYDRGREAVIFVLMELAALAAGRPAYRFHSSSAKRKLKSLAYFIKNRGRMGCLILENSAPFQTTLWRRSSVTIN